jgi:hypothetical protein
MLLPLMCADPSRAGAHDSASPCSWVVPWPHPWERRPARGPVKDSIRSRANRNPRSAEMTSPASAQGQQGERSASSSSEAASSGPFPAWASRSRTIACPSRSRASGCMASTRRKLTSSTMRRQVSASKLGGGSAAGSSPGVPVSPGRASPSPPRSARTSGGSSSPGETTPGPGGRQDSGLLLSTGSGSLRAARDAGRFYVQTVPTSTSAASTT